MAEGVLKQPPSATRSQSKPRRLKIDVGREDEEDEDDDDDEMPEREDLTDSEELSSADRDVKREEPEDDGKVDPALVDAVVQKVVGHLEKIMQKVQDKSDAEKFRSGEAKLSGKKEKVNTKPKLEQVRKGRMNFREAIRRSVTGTHLTEGYESVVLEILEDEGIDGPLGYEPFFEKGKLFVEKGSERAAKKALQQSKDISKLPKIIGEVLEFQEFDGLEDLEKAHSELATAEQVDVDGRRRGFKEALRRLTYEKIQQLKKEGAAEFMAAASAAKKAGKKKFKFGDKEYPVTIKVDIPLKGEK